MDPVYILKGRKMNRIAAMTFTEKEQSSLSISLDRANIRRTFRKENRMDGANIECSLTPKSRNDNEIDKMCGMRVIQ